MILILLMCVLIISLSTIAISIHFFSKINLMVTQLVAELRGYEEQSSYDAERELADELFDTRIKNMKEELALMQDEVSREYTTVADELHPNVRNLPHNKIPNDKAPDVEYAD